MFLLTSPSFREHRSKEITGLAAPAALPVISATLSRDILLSRCALPRRTVGIGDNRFCIRFAPSESASASISAREAGSHRLDLGIDLDGKLLGDVRQSHASRAPKTAKNMMPINAMVQTFSIL